jgi:hypothetical protein
MVAEWIDQMVRMDDGGAVQATEAFQMVSGVVTASRESIVSSDQGIVTATGEVSVSLEGTVLSSSELVVSRAGLFFMPDSVNAFQFLEETSNKGD